VHSYQALHKQFEEMRFRWENRTRYAHELEAQLAEKQPRIDELEDLLAQACDQLQIAADYSDNETDPAVLARIKKALEEKSWIK
jgi:TolA-binding protein